MGQSRPSPLSRIHEKKENFPVGGMVHGAGPRLHLILGRGLCRNCAGNSVLKKRRLLLRVLLSLT